MTGMFMRFPCKRKRIEITLIYRKSFQGKGLCNLALAHLDLSVEKVNILMCSRAHTNLSQLRLEQ